MATNTTSAERRNLVKNAETFRELHKPAIPLVLYNVWDAGSARAVATSGAKAIATSSWAVAKAHGFDDGEQIPFELAMQNLLRIVGAVDLPVSVDLESGYGEAPEDVAKSVSLAIEAGAVGSTWKTAYPQPVRSGIVLRRRIAFVAHGRLRKVRAFPSSSMPDAICSSKGILYRTIRSFSRWRRSAPVFTKKQGRMDSSFLGSRPSR